MTTDSHFEPEHPDLELVIHGRAKDLDGFPIRRILPYARRRSVGPFTFLDHMGPAAMPPGQGMDVRPHPHIGLATVTYLFEGEIAHRDSLGVHQIIRPGDVNWMTAGRGIVHSERTPPDARASGQQIHGMQAWVALPLEFEEAPPGFHHHPGASLPELELGNVRVRLIAGSIHGHSAPVKIFSPLFYLDVPLTAGARFEFDSEGMESALYVVGAGSARTCDTTISTGDLAVYRTGARFTVEHITGNGGTGDPLRCVLFGGSPLSEKRHIYWNFVSSSLARIEQAKADWREGRFPAVPGETEFIPLPFD